MRRSLDRAIAWFNRWLASDAGFVQAFLLTLGWTALIFAGFDKHGFWFLYFATAVSFITQFSVAIIGRRSGDKVDVALQTLLQLARNDEADGDALIAQAEAIGNALEAMSEALMDLQQRPSDTPGGA